MFCRNCGNKIEEGEKFCAHCGMELSHKSKEQKAGRKKAFIIAAVVVGIMVLAAFTVLVIASKGDNPSTGDNLQEESRENGKNGIQSEEQEDKEEKALSYSALYDEVELPVVDLSAKKHVPSAKSAGMIWDNRLFYWLEDTDTLTTADDNIADCVVSKMMFRNAETGNEIQYEIYRDPVSNEIYKIVSIEEDGGMYRLTDFYYENGKPNFMFERYDSVYTPTYATIDKIGERFYFDEDVMVKWRIIREPGEIMEYTLSPEDTWYSQSDYFTESENVRQSYDEEENKRLNQAYNTYEAVTNEKGVGVVEGMVHDVAGRPLTGVKIAIYRSTDGVLLYQTSTDDEGKFFCYTYLGGENCYLFIEGTEKYKELAVYGLNLQDSILIHSFQLTLHKNGDEEYLVTLRAYPATEIETGEDKTKAACIGNITASIREGSGAFTGNVISTVSSDADGLMSAYLPEGTYTVQISAEGYEDTFLEIEVAESAVDRAVYMVADYREDQTVVVLTWEGSDTDLDLTLFTPHQSTGGDMAHIGGRTLSDAYGSFLLSDNTSMCEVMFINSEERGRYKLYVNNYTDSIEGNFSSDKLQHLNVHIYIYNRNGFAADYTVPAGQTGVVWEVAEIQGVSVTPGQRVYKELLNKNWWTENKEKSEWDEVRTAYLEYLEEQNAFDEVELGEDSFFTNRFSLDYIDGDNIPELIYGIEFIGAGGEHLLCYQDGDKEKQEENKINQLDAEFVEYIEGTGLIDGQWGHNFYRGNNIYRLADGEFTLIGSGEYEDGSALDDGYEVWREGTGYWNGIEVTKKKYVASWRAAYGGKGKRIYRRHSYTPEEIKEILLTPRTEEELRIFLLQDPDLHSYGST